LVHIREKHWTVQNKIIWWIITGSYLPLAVREERARFSKGLLDEQQQTEPTSTDIEEKTKSIPAPDIKNTSAYS
jgi:hypothetical protein